MGRTQAGADADPDAGIDPGTGPESDSSRWRRLDRPTAVFLVVGLGLGLMLTLRTPPLSGTDEWHHFPRVYQLSEGILIPVSPPPGQTGVGVCLPLDVGVEIKQQIALNFYGGFIPSEQAAALPPACPRADGSIGAYDDIATFSWYSPLGYAPQAVAVWAGRTLGLDTFALARLARLACLATYLAVVAVAIFRATRARWALVAAALLPVSLVQAAMAGGPDALTLAMTMLVVSSALRASTEPDLQMRPFLVEAVTLSVLLGLCKPTYALVALSYLLVVRRPELRRTLPLGLVPPVVGLAVSTVWQSSRRADFQCDVVRFDITADPDAQIARLVTHPHELVVATLDGFWRMGTEWGERIVAPHQQVYDLARGRAGLLTTAAVLIGALALTLSASPADASHGVSPLRRWALAGISVVGVLAVVGGWLIYCNPPTLRLLWPIHARHLMPLVIVALVALVPLRPRAWARARGPAGLPWALALFIPGVVAAVLRLIAQPI